MFTAKCRPHHATVITVAHGASQYYALRMRVCVCVSAGTFFARLRMRVSLYLGACVSVSVCACVRACVCMSVCLCVSACVRTCLHVRLCTQTWVKKPLWPRQCDHVHMLEDFLFRKTQFPNGQKPFDAFADFISARLGRRLRERLPDVHTRVRGFLFFSFCTFVHICMSMFVHI